MMRLGAAVAVCVCVLGQTAYADRADQLFKRGKRLLAEKRYAEACIAFENSDRLEPGIGAKLNVARCYQEWGKLATAWRWFADAEAMARAARDERADRIQTLVAELDVNVPRLTLKAPPGADLAGLAVKLDGVALDPSTLGSERRVDPGPHQIDYVVDGATRTKTIPLERGATFEVTLELPVRDRAEAPTAVPATIEDPGQTRRLLGIGAAVAGGAAIGIAGLVTLGARGDYKDALSEHCRGATDMCSPEGLTATRGARRRANIATVVTIGGLAAVGGGLALYFLAPRAASPTGEHALYLAPSIGGDGGGVVLGGAF